MRTIPRSRRGSPRVQPHRHRVDDLEGVDALGLGVAEADERPPVALLHQGRGEEVGLRGERPRQRRCPTARAAEAARHRPGAVVARARRSRSAVISCGVAGEDEHPPPVDLLDLHHLELAEAGARLAQRRLERPSERGRGSGRGRSRRRRSPARRRPGRDQHVPAVAVRVAEDQRVAPGLARRGVLVGSVLYQRGSTASDGGRHRRAASGAGRRRPPSRALVLQPWPRGGDARCRTSARDRRRRGRPSRSRWRGRPRPRPPGRAPRTDRPSRRGRARSACPTVARVWRMPGPPSERGALRKKRW